jgi:hypothetical protein
LSGADGLKNHATFQTVRGRFAQKDDCFLEEYAAKLLNGKLWKKPLKKCLHTRYGYEEKRCAKSAKESSSEKATCASRRKRPYLPAFLKWLEYV